MAVGSGSAWQTRSSGFELMRYIFQAENITVLSGRLVIFRPHILQMGEENHDL